MNGIINKTILALFLFFITSDAQQIIPNKYGLKVITDTETYLAFVKKDTNNILVNLKEYIPNIILDIRYATDNNFIGEPVYKIPVAYARLPVAKALKNIQNELEEEKLGLKIYDAYRPYSVTLKFYEKIGDPDFVATPEQGSRHNRGCAVDLTVVDLSTGKELKMPTEYDDFTSRAGHNFTDLPEIILQNREKLKSIMTENGFDIYPAEWWHYDFTGWGKYNLMDLSFEELEKLNY